MASINKIFATIRICRVFCGSFTRAIHLENTAKPSLIPKSCLINNWVYKQKDPINLPINPNSYIELPNRIFYSPELDDPVKNNAVIEEPTKNEKKEAVRMIIIRRKKMKKHKLKKLRKRLKYIRAKIRQKREWKKEKEFQSGLIKQCKEAEAFSAEDYVQQRINAYKMLVLSSERK